MNMSVFYHHIEKAAKQEDMSVNELLTTFAGLGLKAVDVDYDALVSDRESLCRELSEAGIRICSVNRFFSLGENFNKDELLRTVTLCAEVGAGNLLIVPNLLDEDECERARKAFRSYEATDLYFSSLPQISEVRELLKYAVEAGRQKGVNISLEDFDNELSPCMSANELLWWVKNVDGLKITFDTGNFVFCDENVTEAFEMLREYIVHVHCKDRGESEGQWQGEYCRGLEPVGFGRGYLPVGDVLRVLKNDGYGGYFTVEHFGVKDYWMSMMESFRYIIFH